MLGSGSLLRFVAPGAAIVALGTVSGFCWMTTKAHLTAAPPTERLRRVRDGLVAGLGLLVVVSVGDSSSGDRVGIPAVLRLPVAIVTIVVAAAFAWVAIEYVRREQATFEAAERDGSGGVAARSGSAPRSALERIRSTHGWLGAAAATVALTLYVAGASVYTLPFAGLVLIPTAATWVYAALRTSRWERRSVPEPSPDRSPRPFRAARLSAVALLALAPLVVFWWVWLSVDSWGLQGAAQETAKSHAAIVLWVAVAIGIAGAASYPFFAIAEALRTPTPAPEVDAASLMAPVTMGTLQLSGRGTGTA